MEGWWGGGVGRLEPVRSSATLSASLLHLPLLVPAATHSSSHHLLLLLLLHLVSLGLCMLFSITSMPHTHFSLLMEACRPHLPLSPSAVTSGPTLLTPRRFLSRKRKLLECLCVRVCASPCVFEPLCVSLTLSLLSGFSPLPTESADSTRLFEIN